MFGMAAKAVPRTARSATSRVFLVLSAAVLVVTVAVTALLVWDSRRAEYGEAERTTHALSLALAASPATATALGEGIDSDPAEELRALVSRLSREAGVSYVTVMDAEGIRFTHPDASEIGQHYRGTIPVTPTVLSERWTGTLGPSVRTIAPVVAVGDPTAPDRVLGWVSVGITVESIGGEIAQDLPLVFGVSAVFVALGVLAAVLGRRATRRITGDLSASAVHEALVSHESLRTLSESLRAQTHEHANRLHTAIALLELGRTQDAIEMLADTSRRSQELVDRVTAPAALDPIVSALILGKTAQAAERGVQLDADIDLASVDAQLAETIALSTMDLVTVIGNLLDNAIDAAASGAARPRSVSLDIVWATEGGLRVTVSDSGDGIDPALLERVFDWGVSTKTTAMGVAPEERGVGLALVSRLLTNVGGDVTVSSSPTRFTAVVPASSVPTVSAEVAQ